MQELLDFSVIGINWFPTFLLIFCVLYWLIVIMGIFDLDTLDFDVDVDVDVDADIYLDAGGSVNLAWLNNVLAFLNLKHIPFMVWFTIFMLSTWGATMYFTWLLGIRGLVTGLLVFLPIALVSRTANTPIAAIRRFSFWTSKLIRHQHRWRKHLHRGWRMQ